MSKLSFRARALDASKAMPIFMVEELPDLPDYSAINRAVPQMPSGMEKEEECEHHLQRAICAGLIIPTPEVSDIPDMEVFDKMYSANYKQPRQLIHMQPLTMEQDVPDYDMDSDDERWLDSQTKRLELSPLKFEEMMDRLEKSSGQTVVTLNEAKALLKEDDDLIIAVFDYWLNKRLKLQHPLILSVKTEHRTGTAINNPYLAFRRRTEKMQTRKNRKNDETSYEKMLKLQRDLSRAVTLLELVKRREKIKREYVHLTIEVFEKRYQAKDFTGAILSELSILKTSRPAFTPIFQNHYTNQNWTHKAILKDEIIPRKEKRQYKKRKHKSLSHGRMGGISVVGSDAFAQFSSDEDSVRQASPESEDIEDEGRFVFRRNKLCNYYRPKPTGNWPWCSSEENGSADKRYRYTLTSLSNPKRCIGFARRRMGRGGRVILDRLSAENDDFWRTMDFTVVDSVCDKKSAVDEVTRESVNFHRSDHPSDLSVYMQYLNCPPKDVEAERKDVNFSDCSRTLTCNSGVKAEQTQQMHVVKQEPEDIKEEYPRLRSSTSSEKDEAAVQEMLHFLEGVRRDWLHFRPKTPPPSYESPCYLLPPEESTFNPDANVAFSLELRALDESSVLLDSSTFTTPPFLLGEMSSEGVCEDVPVTDTRQQPRDPVNSVQQMGLNLNVNVGLNTLNTNNITTNSFVHSVNLNNNNISPSPVDVDPSNVGEQRAPGCSRFTVSDISGSAVGIMSKRHFLLSSTLTSPKLNSANLVSDVRQQSGLDGSACISTNGIIAQFGIDATPGTKTKNNKMQPYAYSGEVVGNSNTNTLNLHTSARTVTLNSHSAKILDIPVTNEDVNEDVAVPGKLVSSQCDPGIPPPNNKNKTIVRKNNLVMEVT